MGVEQGMLPHLPYRTSVSLLDPSLYLPIIRSWAALRTQRRGCQKGMKEENGCAELQGGSLRRFLTLHRRTATQSRTPDSASTRCKAGEF